MKIEWMRIDQILLFTDMSENARTAYPAAIDLASLCSADLHFAQFAGALPPFVPASYRKKYYDALDDELQSEASQYLELAEVNATCHLIRDRWTRGRQDALEAELQADLIVMSPHGRTGLEHVLLGSFADRIVQHTSLPVLLFRQFGQAATLSLKLILVPHDFYDRPQAVIPAIRLLSQLFDAKFRFLHVYDRSAQELPTIRAMEEQFMRAGSFGTVEERFAKLVEEELAGVDADLETTEGIPSLQVVQRGKELRADLILLGKREGMGSVAREATRQAACSVMTVPLD